MAHKDRDPDRPTDRDDARADFRWGVAPAVIVAIVVLLVASVFFTEDAATTDPDLSRPERPSVVPAVPIAPSPSPPVQ